MPNTPMEVFPDERQTEPIPPATLNSEEKWCKFFLDADNPSKRDYVHRLTAAEGGIMEAQKTLDKISSDWVLWKRELDKEVIERDRNSELHYARDQGLQQGINQGLQQGINQGLQQGTLQAKLDVARNMKKANIPAATIAQCTGLSDDEIAGL